MIYSVNVYLISALLRLEFLPTGLGPIKPFQIPLCLVDPAGTPTTETSVDLDDGRIYRLFAVFGCFGDR